MTLRQALTALLALLILAVAFSGRAYGKDKVTQHVDIPVCVRFHANPLLGGEDVEASPRVMATVIKVLQERGFYAYECPKEPAGNELWFAYYKGSMPGDITYVYGNVRVADDGSFSGRVDSNTPTIDYEHWGFAYVRSGRVMDGMLERPGCCLTTHQTAKVVVYNMEKRWFKDEYVKKIHEQAKEAKKEAKKK